MTYQDWDDAAKVALAGSNDAIASKWNLDHETRINRQRGQFRRLLGRLFAKFISDGTPSKQAAQDALGEATEQTTAPFNRWQALLPVVRSKDLPSTPFLTHMTARDAARYGAAAHIDPTNPPARFTFARPYMTDSSGHPVRRFIWVTFRPTGGIPDDGPTETVHKLGLMRCKPGDFIYRIALNVDRDRLRPPTVFDAGLNPAWAPPPPGHRDPWGITRHLEDGSPQLPELLAEISDHLNEHPTASLVSPPGTREAVTAVHVDLLAGRT